MEFDDCDLFTPESVGHHLKNNAFLGVDTRALTKKIREKGTMLGKVNHTEGSNMLTLFTHEERPE